MVVSLAVAPARGVDSIRIELGSLLGEQFSASGISLRVTGSDSGAFALSLAVPALALPPPLGHLTSLQLSCPNLQLREDTLNCAGGVLELPGAGLDTPRMRLDFSYRVADQSLQLGLSEVRLAGGRVSVAAGYQAGRWRLDTQARGLQGERLAAWLAMMDAWRAGDQLRGRIDGELRLQGEAALMQWALRLDSSALGFEDAGSRHVAEQLRLSASLSGNRVGAAWRLQAEARGDGGQLYNDPVFLDLAGTPIELTLTANWDPAQRSVDLAAVELRHGSALHARLQGALRLQPEPALERGRLTVSTADLGALYRDFIQPFVVGTAAGDLDAAGALRGELTLAGGTLRAAHLRVEDARLADRRARFGWEGLQADLNWTNVGAGAVSRLGWERGKLYALALGPAQLRAESVGTQLRLLEAASIPVLDGALLLETLQAQGLGSPAARWELRGLLRPVSLEALSRAFDGPPLQGQLAGVIPAVTYQDGAMAIGGALQLQAFGGAMVVRDLSLERPLGPLPRLSADVDVSGINLDTLTQAFAFGKIQGTLEGHVRALQLEGWKPVAFAAELHTVADDPLPHRISQRAVENLTSLGGGPGGALSRSLLRVFEDFSYDQLGLSCRLRAGVCEMGGLGPAKDGYYIVKGAGLPRIDVIGYSRRVDWNVLLQRLQRVISTQGPVIE